MTRYYFDLRDEDGCLADDEGFELPNLEAVQREAVLSLADQARDVAEKAIGSFADLTIEVRDDVGPVMTVTFKWQILRKH